MEKLEAISFGFFCIWKQMTLGHFFNITKITLVLKYFQLADKKTING